MILNAVLVMSYDLIFFTELDGSNKLEFYFLDFFDSVIRSVQDSTLKGKLYHEFQMTKDQDGNRIFDISSSGLVFESFHYLDVTAAPLIVSLASDASFQGNMSQHPLYLKCCLL